MTRNLIDGLEALDALARCGTVTEAGERLGIGQSAVSKRLRALEDALGSTLVTADGRGITITVDGFAALERARPLLRGLEALATPAEGGARLTLVLDEDLAHGWAPRALAEAAEGLVVDTAPARVALELVRARSRDLALVASGPVDGLVGEGIVEEPLVIVHAGLAKEAAGGRVFVPDPLADVVLGRPVASVGSSGAALRLATEGFGDALVPLGVAQLVDLPKRAFERLDVVRPVALFARDDGAANVVALRDALRDRARRRLFGKKRRD